MILCLCEGVSDRSVRDAVRCGARTVPDVGRACRAGTSCGACVADVRAIIRATEREEAATPELQATG